MFEIDIIKIAKQIIGNRRIVFKSLLLSLIVCMLFLIVKPITYISTTTFTPQRNTSALSSLVSLTSFVGITLSDMSTLGEGVLPMTYPQIVYSPEFLRDLMYKKVPINEGADSTTILEFITNPNYMTWQEKVYRYTFGVVTYINEKDFKKDNVSAFSDSLLINLSEQEQFCANRLRKMIKFEVYEKKPTIDFEVEMTNPEVAAYCSSYGYQLLFDFLLRYAQKKIDKRIIVVDTLLAQAEIIKDQKHMEWALCMDSDRDLVNNVARTRQEKLQNEYMISNSFYNEVARERMKLINKNVEEPLVVISHAVVPNEFSNPNYFHILFLFVFFGGIFGCILAYYKK